MITPIIFFITISLSLLFIIIGSLMTKEQGTEDLGIYLALAGFLMMLIIGIASFGGMSYQSGETVVETYVYSTNLDSVTAVTSYNYSSDDSWLSYLISMTLLISGMAGLWGCIVLMGEKERTGEEDLDYDQI